MVLFDWIERESHLYLGQVLLIEKKNHNHSSWKSYTSTDGERIRFPYFRDENFTRTTTTEDESQRRFVFADIVKNDYAAGPPQHKQKENSIICTRAVMKRNNTTSYNLEKCTLPWVVGENIIFPRTS